MILRPSVAAALAAVVLTGACSDAPTAPDALPAPPLPLLSEMRCTATPSAGTLSCTTQGLTMEAGGARRTGIVIGGQHRYIRLTSSAIVVSGDTMSFDVTVQNLLQQIMATADGTTPHPAGVRVAFASLAGQGGTPGSEVEVVNATGTGTFTQTNQPYFQYGGSLGAELGDEGLLVSGEVSTAKQWQVDFGDHTSFTFTVFVSAEVPNVDGSFLRFTQISVGGAHACGITSTGAYCWGNGASGRLGYGGTLESRVPVAVDQSTSGTFTQVSAGNGHTCGITSTGAYCWGVGANGRLGNDDMADGLVPVAVNQAISGSFTQVAAGFSHTCGITSAGAYCWGFASSGQLGNGGTVDSSAPVAVTQTISGTFTQVSAGSNHSCGITSTGAHCWGGGVGGALGNNDPQNSSEPVAVTQTTSGTFTRVAAGNGYSCGITSTGAYCWGNGANGRLGHNSRVGSNLPVAVVQSSSGTFTQISTGISHTCGVTGTGAYCWGNGANGRLGNGGLPSDSVPVAVTQTTSGIFTRVAASNAFSCGITGTGAYCWGTGAQGRLGTGRALQENAPVPVAGTRGD